jgi:hypothetical protein
MRADLQKGGKIIYNKKMRGEYSDEWKISPIAGKNYPG